MTARDRQRRYRDRRRAGRRVLRIEVDDVDLAERLIASGFLARVDADDPAALARATARLLTSIESADVRDA